MYSKYCTNSFYYRNVRNPVEKNEKTFTFTETKLFSWFCRGSVEMQYFRKENILRSHNCSCASLRSMLHLAGQILELVFINHG